MENQMLDDRGMWLYNHPKVTELKDAGINNDELIFTAMTVYIHLIEVSHWYDVQMHHSTKLMKILITGCKSKENIDKEVFLPVSATSMFSPHSISCLMEEAFFQNLSKKASLNVAIVSGDSSILFYKLSDGLVPLNLQR